MTVKARFLEKRGVPFFMRAVQLPVLFALFLLFTVFEKEPSQLIRKTLL